MPNLTLLQAIGRYEGFLVTGSRAQRNHNPGNINFGDFARAHGATHGDDKGYAVFVNEAMGYAALKALLKTAAYRGKTLEAAIMKYCPPKGDIRGTNDTAAYVTTVSGWTGIRTDEVIDPYLV